MTFGFIPECRSASLRKQRSASPESSNQNGTTIQSGEPAFGWGLEGDYNDNSGDNKMETYLQYLSANGSIEKRPIFFQMDRTTNAVTLAAIAGNFSVGTDANILQTSSITSFQVTPGNNNVTLFPATNGADTTLNLEAASGHAPAINLYYSTTTQITSQLNSPNSTSFMVEVTNGSTLNNIAHFYGKPQGASGAAFAVGVDDNSAVGVFDVGGSFSSEKGLIVRGHSAQTGDLLEAQNSSDSVLDVINASGNMAIGAATASTTFQVAGASSTIRIGTASLPGCLEMGNSDGSAGINYITVLNGVLSATTTKPSNCE